MKITYISALLFSLTTATCAQADDAVVTWKDDVRGWYLGVDRSIGDGCFMYASYNGGTFVRFQFNPQENVVNFIVGNEKWRSLEESKFYDLSVAFGRESPWNGQAEARFIGDEMSLSLNVPFSEDRAATFIEELRRATVVDISYQGRTVDTLSLSGSFAAVTELLNCQTVILDDSTGSDPFSSSGEDPFQ